MEVSQPFAVRGAQTNKIEQNLPYFKKIIQLQALIFFQRTLDEYPGVLVFPGAVVGNLWGTVI